MHRSICSVPFPRAPPRKYLLWVFLRLCFIPCHVYYFNHFIFHFAILFYHSHFPRWGEVRIIWPAHKVHDKYYYFENRCSIHSHLCTCKIHCFIILKTRFFNLKKGKWKRSAFDKILHSTNRKITNSDLLEIKSFDGLTMS